MLFGKRRWWGEADDLDELVLKDSEVRVPFLESICAKRLNDADVVASMGFWLRFLIPMREGQNRGVPSMCWVLKFLNRCVLQSHRHRTSFHSILKTEAVQRYTRPCH